MSHVSFPLYFRLDILFYKRLVISTTGYDEITKLETRCWVLSREFRKGKEKKENKRETQKRKRGPKKEKSEKGERQNKRKKKEDKDRKKEQKKQKSDPLSCSTPQRRIGLGLCVRIGRVVSWSGGGGLGKPSNPRYSYRVDERSVKGVKLKS